MLEAFVQGLLSVFSPQTFGLMMAGIVVGFAVGILPGLGGPVALTIMLPFTFGMNPVGAFAFLLGMLAVLGTTGDITSVLFGVPGEATTAATILDGHPMAKRGEAGRALGAALMSSLVGAVLGAFVLAISIPVAQPLVLSFGNPEFFMLAIVGVAFVAALVGNAVRRGLIAGGLGLTLSLIGLNPLTGVERFTFGQITLWDGLSLIPVVIGLYAVPEILELGTSKKNPDQQVDMRLAGVGQGIKDTFSHIGLVMRCSMLGTFLGLIPGLGASLSQWAAYSHAVQTSRDKSQFGRGDVRGVLGPGAANNSSLGGSLIPAIVLGLPSNVVIAILLGAFLIHGLVPGPDMLTKNVTLTFSMVWIIVVSNVITIGLCFTFLKQLARISTIRPSLLMPFLVVLVAVSAFTADNSYFGFAIMIIFGILGWVMAKLGWPRPPIILGLVLGRLAETYFYLTVGRYEWHQWLTRPIVMVLIVLMLIAIFYPIIDRRRAMSRERAAIEAEGA